MPMARTKSVRSHTKKKSHSTFLRTLCDVPRHSCDIQPWLHDLGRTLARESKFRFKELVTSFLGLHFVWSVLNSIILSIIIYPLKNMSYTDALFQAVSTVTNTGMNTVDIGDLGLYQQIFIFIFSASTHPCVVNQFLCLYRLWLFKRHFAGIDATSRFQSKLRRTATMARTQESREGAYTSRDRPDAPPFQIPRNGKKDDEALQDPLDSPINAASTMVDSSKYDSVIEGSGTPRDAQGESSGSGSSESSKSSQAPYTSSGDHKLNERDSPPNNPASPDMSPETPQPAEHKDIRFGNLPVPPSHHDHHHNPQDMFRSLNMMQTQRHEDDEDEGPALVIKSPRDIEQDEAMGIDSAVYDQASGFTRNFRRGSHATNDVQLRRDDTMRSGISNGEYPNDGTGRSLMSNYLSWTPTIARNSAFVGLTEEQREELGGVEYCALKVLRWLIPFYFFLVLAIGTVIILPWCYARINYRDLILADGQNPGWFALTVVVSGFCNNGLNLVGNAFPDFHNTAYFTVFLAWILMAGNVFLPIMFRFMLWCMFHLSPRYGRTHESLGFLLDHPRRFTMLYLPRTATLQVTAVFLGLMVIEITLFMILNEGLHNPYPDMTAGPRLLCAFFQSVSTRNAGFSIMNLGTQHPAMLVLNIVSMYTAVYPIAMAIRQTNVYEEQTLGIYYHHTEPSKEEADAYDGDDDDDGDGPVRVENEGSSALVSHIQRQLSIDLWGLIIALIVICITEGGKITRGEFDIFDVMYEVFSAYGTVGLSLGFGNTNLSLSGGFTNLGKLAMIMTMIRGLHRGLPYRMDRAVLMKGSEFENGDKIQQERALNPMVYKQPDPREQLPLLERFGTTATRLRSVASLGRFNTHNSVISRSSRRSSTRDVRSPMDDH